METEWENTIKLAWPFSGGSLIEEKKLIIFLDPMDRYVGKHLLNVNLFIPSFQPFSLKKTNTFCFLVY